jgi:hypothetical protein
MAIFAVLATGMPYAGGRFSLFGRDMESKPQRHIKAKHYSGVSVSSRVGVFGRLHAYGRRGSSHVLNSDDVLLT